jgi:peptide/nickel transport system permease protein
MRGVSGFILARATSAGITLLGVTLIVFIAIHLIPGRFEEILVPRGTPEFRHALAVRLGLDLPLSRQYLHWLGCLVAGDLGASLITSQPISSEFAARIPVTLELATLAMLTAVATGAPLGLLAGLAGGTRMIATLSRLFCGLTMSIPDFVLGSLFLYLFSKYALGLTVGQYVPFSTDPVGHLRCIVLPVLTLAMVGIGTVAAVTREAIVAIADQDYVFAAAARGRSPCRVSGATFFRQYKAATIRWCKLAC